MPNCVEGLDHSSLLSVAPRVCSVRDDMCKAPSARDTVSTDLNDNNLSDTSLVLLLAGCQLYLPEHGHCKFIPKQLGLC